MELKCTDTEKIETKCMDIEKMKKTTEKVENWWYLDSNYPKSSHRDGAIYDGGGAGRGRMSGARAAGSGARMAGPGL